MQNSKRSLYSGVHLRPLRFVQLAFKLLGLLGKFSVVVGVQLQQGRCVASLGDGDKLDLYSSVELATPESSVSDPFLCTYLISCELVAVDALAGRQGIAVAVTIRLRECREDKVTRTALERLETATLQSQTLFPGRIIGSSLFVGLRAILFGVTVDSLSLSKGSESQSDKDGLQLHDGRLRSKESKARQSVGTSVCWWR